MSNFKGQISKLTASLLSPIEYTLPIGNEQIAINKYINQKISIEFKGEIFCSSVNYKNAHGFQFHPEKSREQGLKIIQNILQRK